MNELSYQKLFIQVVKAHGGFAYKSGSKFLIGVSDIFFTLPEDAEYVSFGAGEWDTLKKTYKSGASGFLECKLDSIPVRSSTLIHLDTTVKQQEFLRNIEKGGARAGVISFIRNVKHVGVCIVRPEQTELTIAMYTIDTHVKREPLVWSVFERWLNNGTS